MADETIANPVENPDAYIIMTLDGVPAPGQATLKSGGNRKDKFEQQQSPNTAGAFTVYKGQELSTLQYEYVLWRPEHFDAMRTYLEMLNAGRKKRPPKVYKIVDSRIAHNNITDVSVADISALQTLGPGKWSYIVDFAEIKKKAPYGGAPKRPKTEQEKKVEALSQQNADLQKQLDAASKGA